ncbi:histone H1-like [Phragmites australis]|uniref:histone H1-like n=1 Tax=Phragmites australis TaxID=29695 RepID=UPI002D783431|nr:histone H1-like [Phragmites australis]
MAAATEEAAPAVVGETPAPEAPKVEETPKVEEGEGKKAEKKARKPRSRKPKSAGPHHPPYFEMIKEAILALDGKPGSSSYAIAKYMGEKHRDVLPANYRKVLAVQLRSFAAKGRLVKVKASFKLAPAEEKKAAAAAAAKKAATKRKRTPAKKLTATASAPKEAKKARAKRARKAAPAPAQPKPKQPRSTRTAVANKANKASA